jgi:hypothetical protein
VGQGNALRRRGVEITEDGVRYAPKTRRPGQTRLAEEDLSSPPAAKPTPAIRAKKPRPQQKIAKLRPQAKIRIANSRIQNEFASLVERAFRGY